MDDQSDEPLKKRPTSVTQFIFRKPLPLETETSLFILVSVLDIFMTWILLSSGGFVESNPIAIYFLLSWGKKGFVGFKFAAVVVVCISTQLIATKRPALAKLVLNIGTLVVTAVVVYSIWLYLNQPTIG